METAALIFYAIMAAFILFAFYKVVRFFFKDTPSYPYETDFRGNDKVITRKNSK